MLRVGVGGSYSIGGVLDRMSCVLRLHSGVPHRVVQEWLVPSCRSICVFACKRSCACMSDVTRLLSVVVPATPVTTMTMTMTTMSLRSWLWTWWLLSMNVLNVNRRVYQALPMYQGSLIAYHWSPVTHHPSHTHYLRSYKCICYDSMPCAQDSPNVVYICCLSMEVESWWLNGCFTATN